MKKTLALAALMLIGSTGCETIKVTISPMENFRGKPLYVKIAGKKYKAPMLGQAARTVTIRNVKSKDLNVEVLAPVVSKKISKKLYTAAPHIDIKSNSKRTGGNNSVSIAVMYDSGSQKGTVASDMPGGQVEEMMVPWDPTTGSWSS